MSKFSWISQINSAKKNDSEENGSILCSLSESIQREPMQGFEVSILSDYLQQLEGRSISGWLTKRVAIIGNVTTQPIENALRVALFAEGCLASIYSSPFSTYQQEALDSGSGLYQFEPDLILIYVTLKDVLQNYTLINSSSQLEEVLQEQEQHWGGIWDSLGSKTNAKILQHTYVSSDVKLCGVAENRGFYSVAEVTAQINRRLMNSVSDQVSWVDVDQLAADVGRRNWFDPRLEFHGKYPFALCHVTDYLGLIRSVLRDILGKKPKVLVLDLDNTLWGGVIGDDGLDGIVLGDSSPGGEAYQAFCEYILNLSKRGVIISICSKNDFENAKEVFDEHPCMPLNLQDFAVVKCNWNNKADNLLEIAKELNVDVSTLVFVDDNPAECELVMQTLPSVCVLKMDGDPAGFIRKVGNERLFETQRLTAEDLSRGGSYQARAKVNQLMDTATNIESFLSSLEMKAVIREANSSDIARLEQMEAKTNQFNLSTRRSNASSLKKMLIDENRIVLCANLSDKFSDYGLVSYMAVEVQDTSLLITDWIMSCRVFSRTLENKMLEVLLEYAEKENANVVSLKHNPTPKNSLMVSIFKKLGFEELGTNSNSWSLSLMNKTVEKSMIS
jgi:FkbH-like protein